MSADGDADRSAAETSRDDHDGYGWVLLSPDDVPERWLDRGRAAVVVPLMPDELRSVLGGNPTTPTLDERDHQLARMVTDGASIRQMASEVGLSPRGVQHRLAGLRERFGVDTTAELVAELVRRGVTIASRGNSTPQEHERAASNQADNTDSTNDKDEQSDNRPDHA